MKKRTHRRARGLAVFALAWFCAACSLTISLDDLVGRDDGGLSDASVLDTGAPPTDAGDAPTGDTALAPTAYVDEVMADAPLAYWRLGDGPGPKVHDQIGAHDGTLFNTASTADGPLERGQASHAFAFSAAGYVRIDSVAALPKSTWTGLTIEAWVNPGRIGHLALVGFNHLDGANSAGFILESDGTYRYHDETHALDATVHAVVGTWAHLVATLDGTGRARLYVNGTEDGTLTGLNGPSGSGFFTIAAEYDAVNDAAQLGDYFTGRIAEVAVYNKVLTADRIRAHHDAAASK